MAIPAKLDDAMCVASGIYGPFDDGRTIPWVEFSDGEAVYRANCAEGVEPPAKFSRGSAQLEVYSSDKGLRLRYLGGASRDKAAA